MWQRRQILGSMLAYVCRVIGEEVGQDEYFVPYYGAALYGRAANGDAEAYGRLLEAMSNHELNKLNTTGWDSSFLFQSLLDSSRRRMERMRQYMF